MLRFLNEAAAPLYSKIAFSEKQMMGGYSPAHHPFFGDLTGAGGNYIYFTNNS
jgi:hypothetical protein